MNLYADLTPQGIEIYDGRLYLGYVIGTRFYKSEGAILSKDEMNQVKQFIRSGM